MKMQNVLEKPSPQVIRDSAQAENISRVSCCWRVTSGKTTSVLICTARQNWNCKVICPHSELSVASPQPCQVLCPMSTYNVHGGAISLHSCQSLHFHCMRCTASLERLTSATPCQVFSQAPSLQVCGQSRRSDCPWQEIKCTVHGVNLKFNTMLWLKIKTVTKFSSNCSDLLYFFYTIKH